MPTARGSVPAAHPSLATALAMPPLDAPGPAACTSRDLLLPTAPELLSQSPQCHGGPVPPGSAAVWHPSGRCPCGDGARDTGSAPDASPETTALAPRVTLPWCPHGSQGGYGLAWGGTSGAGGLGTGTHHCGGNNSVPQFPLLSHISPIKHLPPPTSLRRILKKALCQDRKSVV